MTNKIKNKLLLWLVLLLLVGNAVSITIFWLGSKKPPDAPRGGTPKEFLIKELKFNNTQQEQLESLMTKHREETPVLRKGIKQAKKELFDLLKDKNAADSMVQAAAKAVSQHIEQLDMYTYYHLKKIRELCTAEQQAKFDHIIHEITTILPPPTSLPDAGAPRKNEDAPLGKQ
jgi:Spy/CpxP family protein refolding chaperone